MCLFEADEPDTLEQLVAQIASLEACDNQAKLGWIDPARMHTIFSQEANQKQMNNV